MGTQISLASLLPVVLFDGVPAGITDLALATNGQPEPAARFQDHIEAQCSDANRVPGYLTSRFTLAAVASDDTESTAESKRESRQEHQQELVLPLLPVAIWPVPIDRPANLALPREQGSSDEPLPITRAAKPVIQAIPHEANPGTLANPPLEATSDVLTVHSPEAIKGILRPGLPMSDIEVDARPDQVQTPVRIDRLARAEKAETTEPPRDAAGPAAPAPKFFRRADESTTPVESPNLRERPDRQGHKNAPLKEIPAHPQAHNAPPELPVPGPTIQITRTYAQSSVSTEDTSQPKTTPAAPPTSPIDPAEIKTPAESFSIHLGERGRDGVDLRFSQHQGTVEVTVHTQNAEIRGQLASELPQLESSLNAEGWQADFSSETPTSRRHVDSVRMPEFERSSSTGEGSGGQTQRDRWTDELEERRAVFAARRLSQRKEH